LIPAGAAVAWIDHEIDLAAVVDAAVAVAVAGRALIRAASEHAGGSARGRAAGVSADWRYEPLAVVPACAAVVRVGLEVRAPGAAAVGASRIGDRVAKALPCGADLSRGTGVAARAAIQLVVGHPSFAAVSTEVVVAIGEAGSAVLPALRIFAVERAVRRNSPSARPRARRVLGTIVSASPAIGGVGREAHALAVARRISLWTSALALEAGLAGSALRPASAAVCWVEEELGLTAIVDEAVAITGALFTNQLARALHAEEGPIDARGVRWARVAARAAMKRILVQVRRANSRNARAGRVGGRAIGRDAEVLRRVVDARVRGGRLERLARTGIGVRRRLRAERCGVRTSYDGCEQG